MDLRNNQITMRELLANQKAEALLKKEFPQFTSPLILNMAKGMTLTNVLKLAKGKVSQENIDRVLAKLEDI